MFAIIDTETTGGKPLNDRITEIAIIVHNGKRVVESYSTLINPCRKIDPFVSGMTGITDEMVADAPIFADVVQRVIDLTEGKIFVAHNVRFDYGVIRNEFKRLGKTFIRKQLCTVKLSRKIIPGLPSYSLGRLCESLDIHILNRHRALGDAEATSVLFEKLLLNDRKEVIRSELAEGLVDGLLPPNLLKSQVEELPEEPGVYYFLDQQQKVLYIGKSNNIRKRVISHFSNDLKSQKSASMKEKIYYLDYRLTGNELVALLQESHEIKRQMPPYNLSQRIKKYRQGVFLRADENGFQYFKMEALKLHEEPVIKATTPRIAQRMIDDLNLKHSLKAYVALTPKLIKLGTLESFRASHNEKISDILKAFYFSDPHFFIVTEAINPEERTLIWIENNQYKGIGNVSMNENFNDIDSLKNSIQLYEDHPDIRGILKAWLKKSKKTELIKYSL